MSVRSNNRPAPPPPSGVSRYRKPPTFNSFISKDKNNNPKGLITGPTVIKPTGGIVHKKKPPPRPAPPKNYQGKKGSSQFSPPPDLLADLHDIFGPPVTQSTKNSQPPMGPRLNSSQRWKKAPAPPKPISGASTSRNGPNNSAASKSISLIDFDSFDFTTPMTTKHSQFNNQPKTGGNTKPMVDLLTQDPFETPNSTSSAFQNTLLTNTLQSKAFNQAATGFVANNASGYVANHGASFISHNAASFVPNNAPGFVKNNATSLVTNNADFLAKHAANHISNNASSITNNATTFALNNYTTNVSSNTAQNNKVVWDKKAWQNDTGPSTPTVVNWGNNSAPKRSSILSPPEPQFPPPPPPPSAAGIDPMASAGICLRALYDFQAADAEELSFMAGEEILLVEKVNNDWWKGSLLGKTGLFPSSYVETLELESPPANIQIEIAANSKECFVTAVYDFDAEQAQDLTFRSGDKIQVLYRINQNWLFGKSGNREGQFPANFVQKPNDVPTCLAKYDFRGENSDELSFEEGHVIVITEKVSSDWWKGYCSNDVAKKTGLFPAEFVQEAS